MKRLNNLKVIRLLAAHVLKSIPRFPAPCLVVPLPETVVQFCMLTPGGATVAGDKAVENILAFQIIC